MIFNSYSIFQQLLSNLLHKCRLANATTSLEYDLIPVILGNDMFIKKAIKNLKKEGIMEEYG